MDLSKSAINRIGDIVRQGKDAAGYSEAIEMLNAWREQHGYLMDQYYDKCVKLAKRIDGKNIIVAERLKRLPTIIGKLGRFEKMSLSRMQDIAGVRVIVDGMDELKMAEKYIRKWGHLVKIKDYIEQPKESGYRGKHFIFEKDGMFVEIQLRTQFQHLWATSVETTDIFRGSSLKEKGDKTCWHDFFCQVSSIFAIVEDAKVIPGYDNLGMKEICEILKKNMKENHIDSRIASFALTEPIASNEKIKGAYYIVMSLDFKKKTANIIGYKEAKYHLAVKEYQTQEKENSVHKQTVLVAVSQIKKIREAYPNYFMNLNAFLSTIEFILEKNKGK